MRKDYKNVPRVVANESRLGQVLLNLIVNAVQAIPEGNYEGNEIRIATSVESDRVIITIRDTGIGMSAETRRRLFTPFFTTRSRSAMRSGATCHRITTSSQLRARGSVST